MHKKTYSVFALPANGRQEVTCAGFTDRDNAHASLVRCLMSKQFHKVGIYEHTAISQWKRTKTVKRCIELHEQ